MPPPRLTAPPRRWLWMAAVVGAAALFAAVFVQSSLRDRLDVDMRIPNPESAAMGLEMFNASVSGRSGDGEPFIISAASAAPDQPNPGRVLINGVAGSASLADGRTARMAATRGMLYVNRHLLNLTGGVRLETNDGYWLVTDAADFDSRAMSVATEGEVVAAGPIGRIRADRLEVLSEGGRVARFAGNVRMSIAGLPGRGAGTAPEAPRRTGAPRQ